MSFPPDPRRAPAPPPRRPSSPHTTGGLRGPRRAGLRRDRPRGPDGSRPQGQGEPHAARPDTRPGRIRCPNRSHSGTNPGPHRPDPDHPGQPAGQRRLSRLPPEDAKGGLGGGRVHDPDRVHSRSGPRLGGAAADRRPLLSVRPAGLRPGHDQRTQTAGPARHGPAAVRCVRGPRSSRVPGPGRHRRPGHRTAPRR